MASELQKKLLEVYKEIRSICEEHNIRYFAAYGTAIGAVRHGGIIPWDDDIDIEMPWKDYLKFIEIAQKKLPKHLKILNGIEKGGVFIFSKVFDTESAFFISHVLNRPEQFTGVYVDIYPVFGAPAGSKRQRDFERSVRMLDDELWKIRALGSVQDEQTLLDEYKKLAAKYDFDTATHVRSGGAMGSVAGSNIYPKKWYESYRKVPFEHTDIRVPVGIGKLLTSIYGDFMTPPPEGQRVAHMGDSLIDLRHSYVEYKNLMTSKNPVVKNFTNFAIRSIVEKNITIDNRVREINRLQVEFAEQDAMLSESKERIKVLETKQVQLEYSIQAERRKRSEFEQSVSGVKASAKHLVRNIKKKLHKMLD